MADRPAGMVEIPDSLGKDIDNGHMPEGGMPIEEVLHPATVEQIHRTAQIQGEPVRAENLVPITPAEAARRRTQTGDALPSMPVTRAVIPAPYRRDRVTGGRHGKSWQRVAAWKAGPGDMTEAVGKVATAWWVEEAHEVVLTGIGGVVAKVGEEEEILVFR
jgi:hypothetical protein